MRVIDLLVVWEVALNCGISDGKANKQRSVTLERRVSAETI